MGAGTRYLRSHRDDEKTEFKFLNSLFTSANAQCPREFWNIELEHSYGRHTSYGVLSSVPSNVVNRTHAPINQVSVGPEVSVSTIPAPRQKKSSAYKLSTSSSVAHLALRPQWEAVIRGIRARRIQSMSTPGGYADPRHFAKLLKSNILQLHFFIEHAVDVSTMRTIFSGYSGRNKATDWEGLIQPGWFVANSC